MAIWMKTGNPRKKNVYHQLDLFSLFEKYEKEPITENSMVQEDGSFLEYGKKLSPNPVIMTKNVLISLVKDDNKNLFLNSSASIYYTGKKFPATVALDKLYYFMPYIKGKGIRDLYLIKIARLGYHKEGTPKEDKNDLRLVFEIEFVEQIFDDYKSVKLEIWHTFTNITMYEILKNKQ